jgi:hypothetical protein
MTNTVDPSDDRQEAVLRAKAWKDAAAKEAEIKAEPILVDALDDRQEAILRAKKWNKPVAKIIKKITTKKKK